ncbi:MAG: hypothetical protein K2O88_05130, partial [Paramuribaculum sp.]|nr:hypothetical protein [Paramuribaculum sp.]
DNYVLSNWILAIILFNFFIDGMRTSALTFKTKAGIFNADKFTPLLQGIINLILSLILVKIWGLGGVLLATGISILSIGFWQWPRLIYKNVFHQPLWRYFSRYLYYSSVSLLTLIIALFTSELMIFENTFIKVAINTIIAIITIVIVYYLAFKKTLEFKQLSNYCLNILKSKKQ